jgi:putative zinc finger protein
MSCDAVLSKLDEHVDGSLPREEEAALTLHLAACSACREEERRLRELLAAARALPQAIAPGRDLWPGIEARLGGEGAVVPLRRSPVRLARLPAWLAAAAILAAAAGLSLYLLRSGVGAVPEPGGASAIVITGGVPSDLREVAAEFRGARREMRSVLDEHRETLSPATVATVEENLRIIDAAVGQIEAALARDPGNQELRQMLAATRHQETAMLRQVTRAAARH